jgi:hypothetical protein
LITLGAGSAVVAILAVVSILIAAFQLSQDDSDEPATEGTSVPFPTAFEVARFATFAEAEQAAGYHIPNTSAYQLRWNTVFLQPAPRGGPVPEASAIYAGPDDTSFYFDIVVPASWPEGPPSGGIREATIGGWSGLLLEDDDDYVEFAFECGTLSAGTLWCVVKAPDLGMDEVEQFLATVR